MKFFSRLIQYDHLIRLASKTTDVNWSKVEMEDAYGYYKNR